MIPLVEDWITRVRTVDAFKEVGDSMAFASSVASETLDVPSAYIMPASEDATPDITSNVTSHRVTSSMIVLYVVQNFAADGIGGDYLLRDIRLATFGVILGWKPTGFSHRVGFTGGTRLSALESNLVLWQDTFSLQYLLRV